MITQSGQKRTTILRGSPTTIVEEIGLRNTLILAVTGIVFLLAGFRDRFWPGHFTLNKTNPSREEIGIAFAFGLFFLGAAAFRVIRPKPQSDNTEQNEI